MTIARELVTLLRYQLDESGLRRFVAGEKAVKAGADDAARGVRKLGDEAQRTGGTLGRLGTILRTAFAGIGLVSLARISDEWAGVEGRVGLVTEGVEQQTHALKQLYGIAQETGQAYAAVSGLFTSVQRNAKELNLALDESLELSKVIGTAMTIGGGSAASQEAALIQLQQALGTGTLRGEELNSVMEQAPRLAQAIAEAFEVPVGQLKELGKEGKLSSKQLARGLLKQAEKLRAEFERMPLTFSRGLTRLKNAFGQQVDRLNKWTGAATLFYKASSLVIDNLEKIIKTVAYLAVAAGLTKLVYAMRAAAAAGGMLAAFLARFGGARAFGVLVGTFARMLAIMTAIYYVGDDILGWINGADSVTGRLIGGFHEWKWLVDAVREGLTYIKDALGGSAATLGEWLAKWGLVAVIVGGVLALLLTVPGAIVAGLAAIAIGVKVIRDNWAQAVGEMQAIWAGIVGYVMSSWTTIRDGAIAAWNAIGAAIRNAIPEWARKGAGFVANMVGGPGMVAGGLAASAGSLVRPNVGGVTTITQAPQITVNATSSQPAAVASAAAAGVSRGMGAAAVPMVEAGGR